ncbi:kinase protein [Stenotrophomonas phage vB_SmaS-DLP_6]|nr:kinase protein [Stenotrophomonas phage vB_SmaS-DLP_6]
MKTVTLTDTCSKWDYIDKVLRPKGWKYAGSGAYGVVYTKGKAAIKLGQVTGNKGYLKYIESVAELDDNPSKPIVSELTYCTPKDGGEYDRFFIVMMERLQPLHWDDDDDVDSIDAIINRLAYNYRDSAAEIDGIIKKLKRERSKQRGLMKVIEKIVELTKQGCGLDIHSGNLMVRPGTDELVITDPLV